MKHFKKAMLAISILSLSVSSVFADTSQGSSVSDVPQVQSLASGMVFPDFSSIVEKTQGAVVNIRTETSASERSVTSPFGSDPSRMFRFFFGDETPFFPQDDFLERDNVEKDNSTPHLVPNGVGSGFIVSKEGYIITNFHVIRNAENIIVTLPDSRKEYTAQLVGGDQRTDIAVLKIDSKEALPVLSMGNSDMLKKGQWVLAIGSPFELDNTVTAGIVSSINRDTGNYLRFIQTDVAVNPGNSGGPLINLQGQVVGVNSQIISRSGGYQGVSFAIPINDVMKIYEQIKTTGYVSRGQIGVVIGPISEEVAKAIGLENAQGALVSDVVSDSMAEKAGIKAGDVILSVNGQSLEKWSDLSRIIGNTKIDSKVELSVWRKGKEKKLSVVVGEAPNEQSKIEKVTQKEKSHSTLGITVESLSKKDMKKYRIDSGVRVVEVEGASKRLGIRKGDILLQINNKEITGVEEFSKAMSNLSSHKPVALLLRRGSSTIWITATLPKK